MCGHYFCSMKITKDVRKYAPEHGLTESEALEKGLKGKAKEFAEKGAGVYTTAKGSLNPTGELILSLSALRMSRPPTPTYL